MIDKFKKIELLHKLIEQQKTGTPEQLAKRMGISRATLYNQINELKSYNLPIAYSRSLQSFYYSQNQFNINITCKLENIKIEDLTKITGGQITSLNSSNFLDGRIIPLHLYFANTIS
jgi:Predicted transcriptional regulator